MSSPQVSVVIPAYERPEQTQRAINSVSEQSYEPIELIVVDDGSNPPLEDSLSIPHSPFQNVIFQRHSENQGGNVARNTGIELASGEYIAFLDSDDEWTPGKIQRQVKSLVAKDNFEVSYTGVKQVDEQGNLNSIRNATENGDILSRLLRGNIVGTFSSIMVSADTIDRVGRPNPEMPCWQDWEWYLRLASEVEFDAVEEPLTIRHNEGGQISSNHPPKRNEAYPVVREQIQELASSSKEARVGLAYLNYELGWSALINNNYSEARRLFIMAIRKHPKERDFYILLACSGKHFPLVQVVKRNVVRAIS